MSADQPQNVRHERGREMVEAFLHNRVEKADYRALACHAALPLVLTPELLKFLRHEFLPQVSWVAEVDLMLSDLCDEAAEDVYVMKRDARAYLIHQMRQTEALGEARIETVNRLLIERLDYLARNHPAILPHEWQTQRLSAMLYVTEQRDEAARALAEAIYLCLIGAGKAGATGTKASQEELARLTRLVREEAANLQDDYPDLVRLAQLTGKILADRSRRVIEQLRDSGELSQQFQLPGVDIELPLLEYVVAEAEPVVQSPDPVQPSGYKYSCYINYQGGSEFLNNFAPGFYDLLTRELAIGTDKPIFIASHEMEGGAGHSLTLAKAIYDSACYIVLWSPVNLGRDSLKRELELVRQLEERRSRLTGGSAKGRSLILPVVLRGPALMPRALRNIQFVDFSKIPITQRWFSTQAARSKIKSIVDFVIERCREAEQFPEAFGDWQDFALQVEAADLTHQAQEALNLGQYDEARTNMERALKIHRRRHDRDGVILALNDLGEISHFTGDFDRALRCYSEALIVARANDTRSHAAMLLDNLGLVYAATNQPEQALKSYRESLEIFSELNDRNGEAAVLGNLGLLLLEQGETEQAILLFERQLKLAEETRYEQRQGIALRNLGVAHGKLGHSQTTLAYYQRALAIFEGMADLANQADTLYQLCQELLNQGQREEAIAYAERALELHERIHTDQAQELRALLAELQVEPSSTVEISSNSILLSTFDFETVTLDIRGKVKDRRSLRARQFLEELAPGVTLEMVEVPGGKFRMGAPKSEAESDDDERPRREVKISPFFMGKFAITQAQWRVIAGWPKVERELRPKPSYFPEGKRRKQSDDERPVERVSWEDAVECCARLSQKTGRAYRLPTEAEWEYACRAGTTTPFAFGETITPEFVKYDGNYPYGKAPEGKYSQETVPAGSLGIANVFGLFDMHGNVWEWCSDWYSREYYAECQKLGIVTGPQGPETGASRILRGGSWSARSTDCRSALRFFYEPGGRLNVFGFRVVVSAKAQ
jgi:formylglycine-generating enzyme required for sulfatase activity